MSSENQDYQLPAGHVDQPASAAQPDNKPPHKPEVVTVTIDRNEVEIAPGHYHLPQLKQVLGVSADRLLDKVVGAGNFEELNEHQTIVIKGGEVFVSHVQRGSSS